MDTFSSFNIQRLAMAPYHSRSLEIQMKAFIEFLLR
jgi:hypothetical protein